MMTLTHDRVSVVADVPVCDYCDEVSNVTLVSRGDSFEYCGFHWSKYGDADFVDWKNGVL